MQPRMSPFLMRSFNFNTTEKGFHPLFTEKGRGFYHFMVWSIHIWQTWPASTINTVNCVPKTLHLKAHDRYESRIIVLTICLLLFSSVLERALSWERNIAPQGGWGARESEKEGEKSVCPSSLGCKLIDLNGWCTWIMMEPNKVLYEWH